MEATQVIHTNGDVENTITLNPEESNVVLDRLNPNIRAAVEEQLNQQVENLPTHPQISTEELERVLDEAVGIAPSSSMSTMFPEDTAPTTQGQTTELITQAPNTSTIIATEETLDVIRPVEYEIISEFSDNSVSTVPEPPVSVEFNQLNTDFVLDITSRFRGADWYEQICSKEVTLAGCGGIGSWLAFLLARTNISRLYLYDNDVVETGNLSGQLFSIDNVDEHKVFAIAKTIRQYSDYYRITNNTQNFEAFSPTSNVMMCGFDNMRARKTYFEAWRRHLVNTPNTSQCLFVDGRLSVECLQVYCIQGDDDLAIQYYEERCLFSDEEADETVCSYKQTSFMANMIAGMMVNVFVNWCANLAGGFRPVPMFTEYDAITMQMKIKMNAND